MNQTSHQKATEQVSKASRWLILSGAALTALQAIQGLMNSLSEGSINVTEFRNRVLWTLAFMVVNAVIYYVHEYIKHNNGST